jgi:hypothetical protein
MDLDCALNIIKHGGKEQGELALIQMVNRLSWYDKNYEALVKNPIIRLLRPLIKLLAKTEDQHWNEFIPPWVKQ